MLKAPKDEKMSAFVVSQEVSIIRTGIVNDYLRATQRNILYEIPAELMVSGRRFSYVSRSRLYLIALRNYSEEMAKASIHIVNNPATVRKLVALEQKLVSYCYT